MHTKKRIFILLILTFSSILIFQACSEKQEALVEQTRSESKTLSKSDAPPPPPPKGVEFVEYDVPPQPIGGYIAIQKNLAYPEIARKAGIQGRVLIWAKIDNRGDVTQMKVDESLGPNGCDEAAMHAIKTVKWEPAMKDNKPVDFCWVKIPVEFKLK